jgi:hypothetical protein
MIKTQAATKSTLSHYKGLKITLLAAALAACLPASAGLSAVTSRPDPELMALDAGILWFNSSLRPTIPQNRAVTICVTEQVITVRHGTDTDTIAVPDAVITYKPWETQSATHSYGDTWNTSVPTLQATADTFMSGVTEPFPAGLPADTRTITWSGRFESDAPGVTLLWRWSAAGYTQFDDNYDAMNIEPGNRRHADLAGTPLDFKAFATSTDTDGTQFTGNKGIGTKVTAEVTGRCGGIF